MYKVNFDTTDFQFAHGHTPRGRGSWAFSYTRRFALSQVMWAPSNMLYSDAKKWVAAKAQQLSHADVRGNVVRVYVCS